MKTIKVDGVGDLRDAAEEILESLEGRTIVAFRGEMGAGKTTLIREICEQLGVTDTVTRSITSIFIGSTGSKRLSTLVTKSISIAAISVWSNGLKRSSP